LTGTGISREAYLDYRDNGTEIPEEDAKKLADFYKIPVAFLLKRPFMVHYGKNNSFGPIYRNSNYFFAKAETEEDIKRILK